MTPLPRHLPGVLLLRVARLLFVERIVRSTIEPAIADFQHELRLAGNRPGRRLLVRARGYLAFWKLVALVPLIRLERGPSAGPSSDLRFSAIPTPGSTAGLFIVTGSVALFVAAGGPWMAVVLAAAAGVVAVTTHAWYARHPVQVATERRGAPRHPEINFASIPVMENMAGLLVVVGSVTVFAVSLSAFRWFLLAAMASGIVVAVALCRWRENHPCSRTIENSIATH